MSHNMPTEKPDASGAEHLRRIQTAESVLLPISRDAFEKLYLTPKMPAAGNLRRTFGNPTPVSLIGFLIAATPTAMSLMGWRGSGGNGGAMIPVYIFFGGIVQILGAIGEWLLGNTFSCALFMTYGTFWLVQGTSIIPWFSVGINYSPTGDTLEGVHAPEYHATVGLYYVVLALITVVFLVCSIRTNICLFCGILLLIVTFGLMAAVHFQLASGNSDIAAKLEIAAGAVAFALCIPIWYIFVAQLLDSVDFPFTLPVGDLSTIILGKSQKGKTDASHE